MVQRSEFLVQIADVRSTLVRMTGLTRDAISDASAALLTVSIDPVPRVRDLRTEISALAAAVEHDVYVVLAMQQPVASDLRTVLAALRSAANLHRMGVLSSHLATIAERRYPAPAVPAELLSVITDMADVAERLILKAGSVVARLDATLAAELVADDDAMDALHRKLFLILLNNWSHGVAAAIDTTLISRYYERFADHAASIGEEVRYLVSGERPPLDSGDDPWFDTVS
ncbi:phosphate signaling complex PhoU family protein [Fodinicola feengrottensis]|uniref:Phosphate signaling complex protein PhoU n=1 Tax=Fodinicola feengrottensis TaxID=435914 RepID=A0ABN2I549_9ACTN|nr:PhoU domain-containing protein [Fodinicola feengrottensis]